MNKKILIPIMVGILFLTALYFLRIGEMKESFYSDISAARKAGAIEPGWLPKVIPESSTAIYEKHDLDTNAVWLKFKFDRRDIGDLISKIDEIKPSEIKDVAFSNPKVRWWPKELTKDYLIKGQPKLGIYKYNCVLQFADNRQKTVPGFFVIDWHSNIAYYWQ